MDDLYGMITQKSFALYPISENCAPTSSFLRRAFLPTARVQGGKVVSYSHSMPASQPASQSLWQMRGEPSELSSAEEEEDRGNERAAANSGRGGEGRPKVEGSAAGVERVGLGLKNDALIAREGMKGNAFLATFFS